MNSELPSVGGDLLGHQQKGRSGGRGPGSSGPAQHLWAPREPANMVSGPEVSLPGPHTWTEMTIVLCQWPLSLELWGSQGAVPREGVGDLTWGHWGE